MEQIFSKDRNPLYQLDNAIKDPSHHYILALMYNRATDVIVNLINYNETRNYNWEEIRDIAVAHLENKSNQIKDFKPSTYMALVEYMWNGMNKTDLKTALSEYDKIIVAEALILLNGFRNYLSHFYHDIKVLEVSDRMRKFLEDLKREAIEKIREVYIKKDWYRGQVENLGVSHFKIFEELKNHGDQEEYYTNLNGIIFFSSLFLPASEMGLLFKRVQTFKRDDKPEYCFKPDVYSYFSKRDGSSRLGFLYVKDLKEKVKDVVERGDTLGQELKAQFMLTAMNDLIEVLKRKPEHMIEAGFLEREVEPGLTLNDDSEEDEDILKEEMTRKSSPFLQYAVRYLMDFKNELSWENVQWKTLKRYRDGYTTSQKIGKRTIRNKEEDVRIDLMEKDLFEYTNDFTPLNKIYINDKQVYAKIKIDGEDVSIVLQERTLKNIIASFAHSFPDWRVAGSKSEAMLKAIISYVSEYKKLLADIENNITILKENYPAVNFRHLPEKILLLANQKKFTVSIEEIYKQRIQNRIQSILKELDKITPETADAYFGPAEKNKKNKLLQRWYNNMLNTENKLKASKGRQSSKSELDRLSIFHFTLDNRKNPLYRHVEKLADHLPVFLKSMFTENRHGDYWEQQNLIQTSERETSKFNHLFFRIKDVTNQYWKQISESLVKNTLPEHWQNYGDWEMPDGVLVLGKPIVYNRQLLEALARKLDINNPDIENNREIKDENKGAELPRRKKLINDFKKQSVFIPGSYISNLLIDDKEFDARITDRVVEYDGLRVSKIHYRETVSGQIRNDGKLCTPLIKKFYVQADDKERLKQFAEADGKLNKEGQLFLQKSLQMKTLDALLMFIANQYHKKFNKGAELFHLNDYTTKEIAIQLSNKCQVTVPYKKIKQLNFYTEIKKWDKLALLYFPEAKEISYDILEEYLKESRINAGYFIEKILELEKLNNRLIKEEAGRVNINTTRIERTPYRNEYKYIGFRRITELVDLHRLNKEAIIHWRNTALHNDVPDAKYGGFKKAKEEIQKLLPARKRRDENKKDRYRTN